MPSWFRGNVPEALPSASQDDWVAGVFVSNNGVDMALEVHVACKLPDGPHKLYAWPVQVSEAEAMRLRREAFMAGVAWQKEMEAPPVAAPSREAIDWVARALYNYPERATNPTWEEEDPGIIQSFREQARIALEAAHPSPVASEPKDAGSGEGQEINRFGLVKALTAYDRYWENNDDASEALQCAIEAYLAFTRTAPSGARAQAPIAWACERHKEWHHTNDMREVARLAANGWIIYSMYVDDRDWLAEWSKQERSSP